jgi:solute carrier family 25 carnitine/acylcarnitine transporter 20/29
VNVRECVRHTINKYGFFSLWRGLTGTIIRNIPANSLYFPGSTHYCSVFIFLMCFLLLLVYEIAKDSFAKYEGIKTSEITLGTKLTSGACAGLAYWVCTYPLDVVKAQMQFNEEYKASGWWSTAKSIWKTSGIKGFSRGLLPCALRAVPACGIMFTTVDLVREKMSQL